MNLIFEREDAALIRTCAQDFGMSIRDTVHHLLRLGAKAMLQPNPIPDSVMDVTAHFLYHDDLHSASIEQLLVFRELCGEDSIVNGWPFTELKYAQRALTSSDVTMMTEHVKAGGRVRISFTTHPFE
jgi:hypothetical protein